MLQRVLWIFLLGLLFTSRCLAVYLGMGRAELVKELGPPVSRAAMGAHEILLYPNDVRIELQDGKVVDVQGMTVDAGPSASSPVQNAPATPKANKPVQSGAEKAAEVESDPQAYTAQATERAKMEDAVIQMEKMHDVPREVTRPNINPARLLMELFLRWVVILLALKLTCLFWGVTVEWPGLVLVAVADAVTRMILHVAAIHFLNVSSLFGVENIIAAIVMIIVLMKVSINRSWKQAVQLTVTSKTFAIVVWAVVMTAMLRQSG